MTHKLFKRGIEDLVLIARRIEVQSISLDSEFASNLNGRVPTNKVVMDFNRKGASKEEKQNRPPRLFNWDLTSNKDNTVHSTQRTIPPHSPNKFFHKGETARIGTSPRWDGKSPENTYIATQVEEKAVEILPDISGLKVNKSANNKSEDSGLKINKSANNKSEDSGLKVNKSANNEPKDSGLKVNKSANNKSEDSGLKVDKSANNKLKDSGLEVGKNAEIKGKKVTFDANIPPGSDLPSNKIRRSPRGANKSVGFYMGLIICFLHCLTLGAAIRLPIGTACEPTYDHQAIRDQHSALVAAIHKWDTIPLCISGQVAHVDYDIVYFKPQPRNIEDAISDCREKVNGKVATITNSRQFEVVRAALGELKYDSLLQLYDVKSDGSELITRSGHSLDFLSDPQLNNITRKLLPSNLIFRPDGSAQRYELINSTDVKTAQRTCLRQLGRLLVITSIEDANHLSTQLTKQGVSQLLLDLQLDTQTKSLYSSNGLPFFHEAVDKAVMVNHKQYIGAVMWKVSSNEFGGTSVIEDPFLCVMDSLVEDNKFVLRFGSQPKPQQTTINQAGTTTAVTTTATTSTISTTTTTGSSTTAIVYPQDTADTTVNPSISPLVDKNLDLSTALLCQSRLTWNSANFKIEIQKNMDTFYDRAKLSMQYTDQLINISQPGEEKHPNCWKTQINPLVKVTFSLPRCVSRQEDFINNLHLLGQFLQESELYIQNLQTTLEMINNSPDSAVQFFHTGNFGVYIKQIGTSYTIGYLIIMNMFGMIYMILSFVCFWRNRACCKTKHRVRVNKQLSQLYQFCCVKEIPQPQPQRPARNARRTQTNYMSLTPLPQNPAQDGQANINNRAPLALTYLPPINQN